jgi:transposase-like protein
MRRSIGYPTSNALGYLRPVLCLQITEYNALRRMVSTMKKPVEGAGDTWTWTAIDADRKLIVSWLVGGRDADYAKVFIGDLAARVVNRIQLTSDRAYLDAVETLPAGSE